MLEAFVVWGHGREGVVRVFFTANGSCMTRKACSVELVAAW